MNILPTVTITSKHEIAGGAFSNIWQGTLQERPVCLKVLRRGLLNDAFQEVLIWKQLQHPNILPFLGVNRELFNPNICLISPWMANGNILTFLKNHPNHNIYQSVIEITKGLLYIHNLQIVHGDLRGVNILVTDDYHCCIADFGLSHLISLPGDQTSSAHQGYGASQWLPPEVLASDNYDQEHLRAADIYSLGCTIIELYAQSPPYGEFETDQSVRYKVLIEKTKPPRPSQLASDALWELVGLRLLAWEVVDRPKATEVLQALRAILKPPPTNAQLALLESCLLAWATAEPPDAACLPDEAEWLEAGGWLEAKHFFDELKDWPEAENWHEEQWNDDKEPEWPWPLEKWSEDAFSESGVGEESLTVRFKMLPLLEY
ncbi:kinase-like domain-containing protein [Rhodocollybia butyracea]|uniref:Kinase-like domain-containing protein n=1 Tax=Rhodocollybia butyracea TaxID=206335 RepID=A0A9P5UGY6_9AGAR|nr:kinase-like domain-containing protein [Rhodocollybia butyracea]